jgi:GT2 family glycosyltransferase
MNPLLPPRVSIIIVNWNGLEHLETCLESLQNQAFRDFEVVLVDNGSRDGSTNFVRERYPWVRLVELEENIGFAGGNNVGLEHARGEYLVALNNDTRADSGWLAELVATADAHPAAGMVGSRVVAFVDPDIIDSLGVGICPDGMSRGRFRGSRYSGLKLAEVEPILLPSACAALYKRAMLEETGFFDEDFFAYAEDTELGLRGQLAGWGAVLATRAIVQHKYSGTGGVFSPFKVYLVERNHYWAALKIFPLRMLLALPFHTVIRYLVQVKAVFASRGSGGEFLTSGSRSALLGAVLKGTFAALTGAPRMWRKRRRIMRGRKISNAEMARLLQKYRLSFPELLDIQD